jgi:hypothetical protein
MRAVVEMVAARGKVRSMVEKRNYRGTRLHVDRPLRREQKHPVSRKRIVSLLRD